jgi:hypothetical protein
MDITVIIPTYNRLWALPKAIASCRDQNGVNVQVIVVDDGSTDGTWEYLTQQSGIEIYRQQNWGKPWAINTAFKYAKGKYIKFLDSDDWLVPGSLKKQFNLAEQNADIVVAGYEVHDKAGLVRSQMWIDCDDFIAQNLGECDSSHYSAFLFNKEFIADIPHRTSFASANFASRDDRCFMLEVALMEPKIAVMGEATLCHLSHENDRLQFRSGMAITCTNYQHLLIYKNIIKQLTDSDRLTARRIDAALNVLWPLAHWVAKDDLTLANDIVEWIYTLKPDFQIPDSGVLGMLYKNLGFKKTERLLRTRRMLKMPFTK